VTVNVRDTSRLRFAKLALIDGVELWNLPEYPEIEAAPDDLRYVVDRKDRIDRLAFSFYGNAELWWVIALANELRLLPNDMKQGDTLRIPSPRRVFNQILRSPSRGVEGR
jgi:nucleoid-associated protein YgaU